MITREEALAKFNLAKKRKKAAIDEIVPKMQAEYEKRTGLKANYVFVM